MFHVISKKQAICGNKLFLFRAGRKGTKLVTCSAMACNMLVNEQKFGNVPFEGNTFYAPFVFLCRNTHVTLKLRSSLIRSFLKGNCWLTRSIFLCRNTHVTLKLRSSLIRPILKGNYVSVVEKCNADSDPPNAPTKTPFCTSQSCGW